MFCIHCGSRNEDSYVFCTNCGKPLTRVSVDTAQSVQPVASGSALPGTAQGFGAADQTGAWQQQAAGQVTTKVKPVPNLASTPMRVSLVRSSSGKAYDVEAFPATIGKGSGATVRIDGNNTISRAHVRLSLAGAGLVLEELGATNNTYVNGRRLVVGETVALSAGDELQLADEKFTVVIS